MGSHSGNRIERVTGTLSPRLRCTSPGRGGLPAVFRRQTLVPPPNLSKECVSIVNRESRPRWFVRGFLTNILNPKVGVFYLSFVPQFIPPGVHALPFSMLLAFIHATEGILWFLLLSCATDLLSHWLHRPGVATTLDYATGVVLVGFGPDAEGVFTRSQYFAPATDRGTVSHDGRPIDVRHRHWLSARLLDR